MTDWLDDLEKFPHEPWGQRRNGFYVAGDDGAPIRGGMRVGMWPLLGHCFRDDEAAQIVAEHNAMPRLLAIARAVEKVHKRWMAGEISSDAQLAAAINSICAAFDEGEER